MTTGGEKVEIIKYDMICLAKKILKKKKISLGIPFFLMVWFSLWWGGSPHRKNRRR